MSKVYTRSPSNTMVRKIQVCNNDNPSIYSRSILMQPIMEFFKNKENMGKMLSIVQGKAKISLRLLDWFVTNYAKKTNVVYQVNNTRFMVYPKYKSELKAVKKEKFDPFCRGERIYFRYNHNKDPIETTVGQLNFFKWAIENKVVDYVAENLEEIESDMKVSTEKAKIRIQNGERKKRTELSISATKAVTRNHVSIRVTFD